MLLSDKAPSAPTVAVKSVIDQLEDISQIEHSAIALPVSCLNLTWFASDCLLPPAQKPSLLIDAALPASIA